MTLTIQQTAGLQQTVFLTNQGQYIGNDDNLLLFLLAMLLVSYIELINYCLVDQQAERKNFEKETKTFCQSQERYLDLKSKTKDNQLAEVNHISAKT